MSVDRDVTGNEAATGDISAQLQSKAWRKRRRSRRPRAYDDADFHPLVRDVVKAARSYLLAQQDAEAACWCGVVSADAQVTAQYLLLLHALGQGDSARVAELVAFLLAAFDPESGGWASRQQRVDMNASILCYLALKLSGTAASDPLMQQARETIRAMGGAEVANGVTRFYLALFGQCSFDRCPLLPPEFILLPRWAPLNLYRWSRWARATMVPLSVVWAVRPTIAAGLECDVQDLYLNAGDRKRFPTVASSTAGSLRARFWKFNMRIAAAITQAAERSGIRPMRRHALRLAEQWMAERLDDHNGMVGSTTATILTAFAFHCLGHDADSAAVKTCVSAIETAVDPSTGGLAAGQVATQDTSVAMQALSVSGMDPHSTELRRGLEWLLQGEASRSGDWHQIVRAEPGGWSREFPNHHYPHVTATAVVLHTLREPFANNPPSSLMTEDSMVAMIRANSMNLARRQVAVLDRVAAASRRARRWLLAMQNADGGWPCADRQVSCAVLYSPRFSPRIPMHDLSTPESTGLVLQALGSWEMGCGQSAVDRAVSHLRQKQCADGSWLAVHDGCDTRATAHSLLGLRAVGISWRDMTIHAAVRWLLARQQDDGGWSAVSNTKSSTASLPSCPRLTSVVLLALEQAGLSRGDVVRRGIEFLVQRQQDAGNWTASVDPAGVGAELVTCESQLSDTALPLLALARWGLRNQPLE